MPIATPIPARPPFAGRDSHRLTPSASVRLAHLGRVAAWRAFIQEQHS